MSKQVEECVESVLADNPEYDESRAWAICNAQHRGEVTLRGVSDEALRAIRRRNDPDAVHLADDEVRLEGVGGDAVESILTRYNVTPVVDGVETDGMTPRQRSSAAIEAAGGLEADVFRVVTSDDDDRDYNDDVLGVGVDFPNAGVYVDWNIDAWPDGEQLAGPHVSDYDSMADLQQVSEGDIEYLNTVDPGATGLEQRADPMANGHQLDPATGEGVCEATGEVITAETMGDLTEDCPHCGQPLSVLGEADGMTPRQRSSAATGFDVVGGPAAAVAQRSADEFDPDDPPDEYADAIEADDFVIYGKASIQQTDDMGTRISVRALEDALDRFFDSQDAPGIISRGHADVVVGMPVREHTLESDTTLVIDGETYDFDAGETIRTEAKDADGDDVPELWLASRLANDSDIARETRYKALTGELNGYSVTVKPKDGATERTGDGEDILAVDLHAVTVGTDDQILNQGSEFDVAEFRALFDAGEADIDAVLAHATDDALDSLAEDLGRELRTLFQ